MEAPPFLTTRCAPHPAHTVPTRHQPQRRHNRSTTTGVTWQLNTHGTMTRARVAARSALSAFSVSCLCLAAIFALPAANAAVPRRLPTGAPRQPGSVAHLTVPFVRDEDGGPALPVAGRPVEWVVTDHGFAPPAAATETAEHARLLAEDEPRRLIVLLRPKRGKGDRKRVEDRARKSKVRVQLAPRRIPCPYGRGHVPKLHLRHQSVCTNRCVAVEG